MVYAIVVHTLLKEPVRILYQRQYGPVETDDSLEGAEPSESGDSLSVSTRDFDGLSVGDTSLQLDFDRTSLSSFSSRLSNSTTDGTVTSEGVPQVKLEFLDRVVRTVQAEHAFKNIVTPRSLESELQRLNGDGVLPHVTIGYARLPSDTNIQHKHKIIVWGAALNFGFTLVCSASENRQVAAEVIRLMVRLFQDHCRLLNFPGEALLKLDKIATVVNQVLPGGQLMFMNHRVVRQIEKRLDVLLKT